MTEGPDRGREQKRSRDAFFRQARNFTPYIAAEVEGHVFFLSTEDRGSGHALFVRRRRMDLRVLARTRKLLQERGLETRGSIFVEVGANIGATTVSALVRHGFGRAVAIEPAPSNLLALRLNLAANEVADRVTIVEAAATDEDGEAVLALSRRSSGRHKLAAQGELGPKWTYRPVRTLTLDSLVRDGVIDAARVGLLWIDLQRYEGRALEGGRLLLDLGVPVVVATRPESKEDRPAADWTEAKRQFCELFADYTEFLMLRAGGKQPTSDLGALLDSLTDDGDLLAIKAAA